MARESRAPASRFVPASTANGRAFSHARETRQLLFQCRKARHSVHAVVTLPKRALRRGRGGERETREQSRKRPNVFGTARIARRERDGRMTRAPSHPLSLSLSLLLAAATLSLARTRAPLFSLSLSRSSATPFFLPHGYVQRPSLFVVEAASPSSPAPFSARSVFPGKLGLFRGSRTWHWVPAGGTGGKDEPRGRVWPLLCCGGPSGTTPNPPEPQGRFLRRARARRSAGRGADCGARGRGTDAALAEVWGRRGSRAQEHGRNPGADFSRRLLRVPQTLTHSGMFGRALERRRTRPSVTSAVGAIRGTRGSIGRAGKEASGGVWCIDLMNIENYQ